MKRAILVFVAVAAAAFAFFQATSAAPRPLADLVPSGPLIYLEAAHFSQILGDWNSSPEKAAWLTSTNADVFSRSNLMIKLEDVYKEYAEAAQFSPDMAAIQTMSGDASALALYDLREVQFLYITRLPSDRALQSVVGKLRDSFQKREAAGFPFYVSKPRRTVAFAVADGYLILGTREDLVANCLSLIAAQSKDSVTADRWFAQAVSRAKPVGELRMVMNLEALVKSTYFRSYWIQRNIPEVKSFWTGVADIQHSANMIREDRVLLRSESSPTPSAAAQSAVVALGRLVGADAGLYQIWAAPSAAKVTADLQQQVLSPRIAGHADPRFAPGSPDGGNVAGSEADLETRIDEPPLPVGVEGEFTAGPIEKLMRTNPPLAMLEARSAIPAADPLFLKIPGAIAILGASDWNRAAVRSALTTAVESIWTTSALGVGWKTQNAFDQMDGLAQVSMAVRGNLLIVATDTASLSALLDRMSMQSAVNIGASYVAGVSIAREKAPYHAMMSALDFSSAQGDGRDPAFFSANMESLLTTLDRVSAVSVTARDRGSAVEETVEYRLR